MCRPHLLANIIPKTWFLLINYNKVKFALNDALKIWKRSCRERSQRMSHPGRSVFDFKKTTFALMARRRKTWMCPQSNSSGSRKRRREPCLQSWWNHWVRSTVTSSEHTNHRLTVLVTWLEKRKTFQNKPNASFLGAAFEAICPIYSTRYKGNVNLERSAQQLWHVRLFW